MRFQFVAAEKAEYGVALVCRCVAVSAAGFYAWHRRRPSDRDAADRRLAVEIAAAHTASRRTYGSPRIQEERVNPVSSVVIWSPTMRVVAARLMPPLRRGAHHGRRGPGPECG